MSTLSYLNCNDLTSLNGKQIQSECLMIFVFLFTCTIYAFGINAKFGHPSFWRQIQTPPTKNQIRKYLVRSYDWNSSKTNRIYRIDDNVLLECCIYLSLQSLQQLAAVDKRFLIFIRQKKTWRKLCIVTFAPWDKFSLWLQSKMDITFSMESYILYLSKYPQFVVDSNAADLTVILYGSVYTLPGSFLDEHPGGGAILLEWNKRDASRIFDLASHSFLALQLSQNFLSWSPKKYIDDT